MENGHAWKPSRNRFERRWGSKVEGLDGSVHQIKGIVWGFVEKVPSMPFLFLFITLFFSILI